MPSDSRSERGTRRFALTAGDFQEYLGAMIHKPRFLSHAQNREDVRLHRAFPGGTGFYIDVGAADPVEYSVTKSLYDLGWHGINIEPQSYYFERLWADRPRDINLQICLSDRAGETTLYEAPTHRGFSTINPAVASAMASQKIESRPVRIPTKTLTQICELHALPRIDVLKIDVEGHERAVLLGADFKRFRPVVLVIEATEQNATTPNHHLWEDVVLAADYQFAVFDGLNRFYVRKEDAALAETIALAPNVFDDYGPADVWQSVAELEAEVRTLKDAIQHLRDRLQDAQSAAQKSFRHRLKRLFSKAA